MKIKRILGVLFIFLVVLVLVACGDKTDDKGNDEEKAVPVYQGMTVSKELTTLNSRTGYSLMNATIEDSEEVNQDDPYDNFDGSNIEDEIKKDLEVITSDDVEYFVEQVTDFFITIKLSNPDNFEILSFTLNGKFYQSYQFEYGSDSENLILKANSGDVSGIKDFTIDTIKYIDRTEIKDVIFAGDRTIKVGVTYDNLPFARTTNLNIETNSVSFNAEIADINNLIELYESSLKVYLYDGEEIIESIDLEVGSNLVSFSKLKQDTLYQYAVVTSYDALDGNGSVMVVLEKYAFYTNKMLTFGNVNASQENLSFELVIDDKEELGKITVIELFKDSELVESLEDLNSREFNNLLSNNLYEIKVTYTYDLNDGVGVQTVIATHSVTTLTKATPTVEIIEVVETQEEISFELDFIDLDQVGAVSAIELYQGETLVKALTDLSVREFTGLLSDNAYTLQVTYTYDLNDGLGEQTLTINQSATTVTKATPTVVIDNVVPTQTSVSFELDVTDVDQVGTVTSIELYKGSDLIGSLSDLTLRTFSDLLSNNEYTIKVVYTYDLNDGLLEFEHIKTYDFLTLKLIPIVIAHEVMSEKIEVDEEIIVRFYLSNEDQVNIKRVTINNIVYTVDAISVLNMVQVKIVSDQAGLVNFSLTTYFDDDNVYSLETSYNFSEIVSKDLKIVSLYPESNKPYIVNGDYLVLIVENDLEFTIQKIKLIINNIEVVLDENKFEIINNEVIKINTEGFNYTSQQVIISSITYDKDEIITTTNFDIAFKIVFVNNIVKVYTLEDLINHAFDNDSVKILQNNIEMKDINFLGLTSFSGVLDGNNYSFLNFRQIYSSDDPNKSVGFIQQNLGTIYNIKLVNLYMVIENVSQSYNGMIVGTNYGNVYNSEVSGTFELTVNNNANWFGTIVGLNVGGNVIGNIADASVVITVKNGFVNFSKYVGASNVGGIITDNKGDVTIIYITE